jgi:hypothetical protein
LEDYWARLKQGWGPLLMMMMNNILFRIKSFEVLLMQFSPVFCYVLALRFHSQTLSAFVLPVMDRPSFSSIQDSQQNHSLHMCQLCSDRANRKPTDSGWNGRIYVEFKYKVMVHLTQH